ncbi:MAG: DUF3617 family protein [Alphaproteobacteria bacterium]|nr:MAG: DUF3617 family protein [Alphaproteobacteria bacterium]
MRILILASLCLVAACSDGAGDGGDQAAAAEPPATFPAGQWDVTSEVTAFRQADKGAPKIKFAVGDKATNSACVAASEGQKPNPALFLGEGYQCSYQTAYARKGMVNETLSCTRKGLEGAVMANVEGHYTADSFDGTATTSTSLYTDGDVVFTRKLSARRTGECQAAAPAAAAEGAKKKG